MEKQYEEKGYLYENFKVFYLEGLAEREIKYHNHNFDKLIFFFEGDVEYTIEGKSYHLLPNDIILVPRGDSHKIKAGGKYNRLVIYISPEFISSFEDKETSLRDCFEYAVKQHSHVFRIRKISENNLLQLAQSLRDSIHETKEFFVLYQQTLLLQLLIALNSKLKNHAIYDVDSKKSNEKVVELIHYINGHLTSDMDIDSLSQRFYISKYYMMRQFKSETGYTIGNYITQKRLLLARELLKQGQSVTEACLNAGFRDYSTFSRAYKQQFAETPSAFKIK